MFVRTTWVAFLTCCIPAAGPGRAADQKPVERFAAESKHMGVVFRVVAYAPDRAAFDTASAAAFARVAELDRTMSDYNPQSELMQLCKANDAAPDVPVRVSQDLFDVLEAGHAVSKASGGAFDVTVGPVVQLRRIARRTQQLPDKDDLAAALAKVGWEKVTLDFKARTVALKVPGMRLDLGGIAKGYAADAALAVLRDHGLTRALVAAGGDIAVSDPPPNTVGWVVEVAALEKGGPARRLVLANAAVSTSGDLYQFVEIGGVRYSHVLDPKTGLGLTGRRSVTVVAKTGTQADSLTKTASVLPPEKALALIDATPGAAASIAVKATDDAAAVVTESKGFAKFVTR